MKNGNCWRAKFWVSRARPYRKYLHYTQNVVFHYCLVLMIGSDLCRYSEDILTFMCYVMLLKGDSDNFMFNNGRFSSLEMNTQEIMLT